MARQRLRRENFTLNTGVFFVGKVSSGMRLMTPTAVDVNGNYAVLAINAGSHRGKNGFNGDKKIWASFDDLTAPGTAAARPFA